ncbi:hypothetical protein CRG98_001434 [Punica granatum]|uniref:Glycosyltransferase N-terminal domain-containing protein n=1 Tax=Punica granatum TaxID=22663 RepID=A0A2I0LD22_PUNGR|nr:hypothetical protein CRG98_001434 [Punica granatum]
MDREGTSQNDQEKAHILVVTYPVQGHINPLLQFSKHLASKGLKVTLIIPSSTTRFSAEATPSSISVAYIPDRYEEDDPTLSVDEKLKRFDAVVPQTLAEFIREQIDSKFPPKVLVYDSAMVWALDVAREHGLHGAPFFTHSCMVSAIYYLVHHGRLATPVQGPFSLIPSAPPLEASDLPSGVTTEYEPSPKLMSMVINQFLNLDRAKWILVNTFFELEEEECSALIRNSPWGQPILNGTFWYISDSRMGYAFG